MSNNIDCTGCKTLGDYHPQSKCVENLQTRVKELESELAQVSRERSDWKRWLQDSEQQVTALREALGWPERLGMFCMYCGQTSSAMHCRDCSQRIREMPILAAHEFNAKEALVSTTPVAEEAEYLPAAMKKTCEIKEYFCRSCNSTHHLNSKIGKAHMDSQQSETRPTPEEIQVSVRHGFETDVKPTWEKRSQPETQMGCPCNGEEEICIECWVTRKNSLDVNRVPKLKHSPNCTISGCRGSGKIPAPEETE